MVCNFQRLSWLLHLMLSCALIAVIVIPRNCTNDIHICGRCKVQYTLLNLFLEHKTTCNAQLTDVPELKPELNREFVNKRVDVDNLMEVNELDNLVESDKECSQFISLNQLKQFKIDLVEGKVTVLCCSSYKICLVMLRIKFFFSLVLSL